MTWIELLRPRSTEGDVYRDDWIEKFEPIYYGAAAVLGAGSAFSLISQRDSLWGAGVPIALAAMCGLARRLFFGPHLVVGDDTLVLAGVFRTRRLPLAGVRHAVAACGNLKLVLTAGDEVFVPGHHGWAHARGDRYAQLAQRINRGIAAHGS